MFQDNVESLIVVYFAESTQKRHIYYCRTRQAQPIVPRRRSCLSCARAKSRCTWPTKARIAPCIRCSERGFECGGQPTAEVQFHSPSAATTATSPGDTSPTPSTAFSNTSQRSSLMVPAKSLALDPMLDLATLDAPPPDPSLLYWQADLGATFDYPFFDPFAAGTQDRSWDGSLDYRNISEGAHSVGSDGGLSNYTTAAEGMPYPSFAFDGPGYEFPEGNGRQCGQSVRPPYGRQYLSPYQRSEH